MFYKRKFRLVVQVEDSLLAQLVRYWLYYGKPCRLLLRPARSDRLCAVYVNLDSPETGTLVRVLTDNLHVRLYDADGMRPLQVEDVFYT